jgi:hypothetical protein
MQADAAAFVWPMMGGVAALPLMSVGHGSLVYIAVVRLRYGAMWVVITISKTVEKAWHLTRCNMFQHAIPQPRSSGRELGCERLHVSLIWFSSRTSVVCAAHQPAA